MHRFDSIKFYLFSKLRILNETAFMPELPAARKYVLERVTKVLVQIRVDARVNSGR